jgi:phage internal scaffolding protein
MSTLKETTIARRDRKLCPTVDCGEGLTEQSHKDTCDINLILRDYARTGFMRHAEQNKGRYDDVSAVDYQKAMITVAEVKSLFEGLPAGVRKDFNHDPSAFLTYVQNPANAKELEQRGILKGNDGIDITGAYSGAPTKTKPATASGTLVPETDSGSTSDSASGTSTSAEK